MRPKVLGSLLLALVLLSCGGSEQAPQKQPNPGGPTVSVAVAPIPRPGSSPSPSPSPSPGPTPSPSPSPSPSPGSLTRQVSVGITGYLSPDGVLLGPRADYPDGAVIYFDCTAKGQDGHALPDAQHGDIQAWSFVPHGLTEGVDYNVTDTDTFDPDLHVSPDSPDGTIDARCKVDQIWSPWLTVRIKN